MKTFKEKNKIINKDLIWKTLEYNKNNFTTDVFNEFKNKLDNITWIKTLSNILNNNNIKEWNIKMDFWNKWTPINVFLNYTESWIGKKIEIPFWLSEVWNSDKSLKEKHKEFMKSSQFIWNSRYYDIFWSGVGQKLYWFYNAYKDGFFKLNEWERWSDLHDIISWKSDIINYEFFTPVEIAKELSTEINNIAWNEKTLDIWSWLWETLSKLNNWDGIELNEFYVKILKDQWLNIVQKDIEFDKMDKKYKFISWNPPFWSSINKILFKFINDNSTEDMTWIMLLPSNYDEIISKNWFKVTSKKKINSKFKNTWIETCIFTFKKQ